MFLGKRDNLATFEGEGTSPWPAMNLCKFGEDLAIFRGFAFTELLGCLAPPLG